MLGATLGGGLQTPALRGCAGRACCSACSRVRAGFGAQERSTPLGFPACRATRGNSPALVPQPGRAGCSGGGCAGCAACRVRRVCS